MRILHISDLHLGKNIGEIAPIFLIDDQRYVLMDVVYKCIQDRKIDVLLISGDIFDNSNPPQNSLELYDEFIDKVTSLGCNVLAISGNHDSRIRLGQHRNLLKKGGYYISPFYNGKIDKVTLNDSFGPIDFYLLPFITPEYADRFIEVEYHDGKKYDAAISKIIDSEKIDFNKRNVILSHQLVFGSKDVATRSPSDSKMRTSDVLGNISDLVAIRNYERFDYVALGHIHKKMSFHKDRIVYPGAILQYHQDEKLPLYMSYVELNQKGEFKQEFIEYLPLRPIVKIEDTIENIFSSNIDSNSLVSLVIKGDCSMIDSVSRLQKKFANIVSISRQKVKSVNPEIDNSFKNESAIDVIKNFYKSRMGYNGSTVDKKKIEKELKLIDEIFIEANEINETD